MWPNKFRHSHLAQKSRDRKSSGKTPESATHPSGLFRCRWAGIPRQCVRPFRQPDRAVNARERERRRTRKESPTPLAEGENHPRPEHRRDGEIPPLVTAGRRNSSIIAAKNTEAQAGRRWPGIVWARRNFQPFKGNQPDGIETVPQAHITGVPVRPASTTTTSCLVGWLDR